MRHDSALPGVAWSSCASHAGVVAITHSEVTIKPSRQGLVFMLAWIGFLGLLMVLRAFALWLFCVVLLACLVPVALTARSRLSATGNTLTYRELVRTRVWRRHEIEGFAIPTRGHCLR